MNVTMEDLRNFLQSEIQNLIFKRVEINESLVKSRLLDSITLVDVAVSIEEKTGIRITRQDFVPENFDTIELMVTFIASKI